MFSSTSSSGYLRKMYFYTQVDSPLAKECLMTQEELLEEPGKHVDVSEDILEVMYCTNPLCWWQLYKGAVKPTGLDTLWGSMHHAYIVFKTQNWWWSIEKNATGVTIQRSKAIESVRDEYNGNKRRENLVTKIDCTKKRKIEKRRTIKQFIEYIQQKNFIGEVYDVFVKNCQDFAAKIYDGSF